MATRRLDNVIPTVLFWMLAIVVAYSAPSNTTTEIAASQNVTNNTHNTLASTNNTQASTNNTHHRCQVWKNKCERHIDLYCQEENTQQEIFSSCCDAQQKGASNSGTYTIKTTPFSTTQARCDMEKGGGGWMVIVRRSSSETNFKERLLHEYEDGFGSLDGDLWYGLKTVSHLTSRKEYELRVDLYNSSNDTQSEAHAVYSSFRVSSEDYKLHVGEFHTSSSYIQDSLKQFNGRPFLAKRTYDEKFDQNDLLYLCTDYVRDGAGGWWFADNCVGTKGHPGSILSSRYRDLYWYATSDSMRGYRKKFAKYELKMRLKACSEKMESTNNSRK